MKMVHLQMCFSLRINTGKTIEHIFIAAKLEQGSFSVENAIQYADIEHMDDPKTRKIVESGGYIWSRTLEAQI